MERLTHVEVGSIAEHLVVIKQRLFEIGLPETGHALDVATQKLGWEAASKFDGRKLKA